MNVLAITRVMDLLVAAGLSTEYVDAGHDILWLPVTEKDSLLAESLKDLGCHWSTEGECWGIWV